MTTEDRYFFSIIIPAHNEEKYLAETLSHIQALEYPKDRYEVLVIENGSSDKTFEIAQKFAGANIFAESSPLKGVSRAKNLGMKKLSPASDWTIFLDADTILKKNFLTELNAFLKKNENRPFAIGTTSVRPLENQDWYARAWMRVYDMGHKFTKTSLAIQIMKTAMKDKAHFDPELALAEDLKFIKDLLHFGEFFYVDTGTVLTSTRRFEKVGWVTLFVKWNWDALVWAITKKKKEYPVIR